MARVKVWLDGEILTASDLNAEFDNALASSLTPDTLDDVSGNLVEMQAVADPYPAGAASLATTMRGEIQRLRYLLKQITGKSEWYIDPDTTIAAIQTALTSAVVLKTLFDANTILAADADNVPAAVTIAADRVVGRKTGGNITALTLSEILDFIGSAAAGDILYRGASSWARLAKGTTAQYLKGGDTPSWATPLADGDKGDITVSGSGGTWTIDSAVIDQSRLKTSTGTVDVTSGTYGVLPGGEYAHTPQSRITSTDDAHLKTVTESGFCTGLAATGTSAFVTRVSATIDVSARYGYVTYQSRYHTSSGEVYWIFIWKRKTGEFLGSYQAPDHPCFGNGGKPGLVPTPFPQFNPVTDDMIVINPTDKQIEEINKLRYVDNDNIPDLTTYQVIEKYYDIIDDAKATWPVIDITVGLPEGHDWATMIGKAVKPIKKAIPKPVNVILRTIVKKDIK